MPGDDGKREGFVEMGVDELAGFGDGFRFAAFLNHWNVISILDVSVGRKISVCRVAGDPNRTTDSSGITDSTNSLTPFFSSRACTCFNVGNH